MWKWPRKSTPKRNFKVYWDKRDWWWGYYRSDKHHYVIVPPIFCLVLRWDRRNNYRLGQVLTSGMFSGINYHVQASCPPNKAYFISKLDTDSIFQEYSSNALDWPDKIVVSPETIEYIKTLRSYKYPPSWRPGGGA